MSTVTGVKLCRLLDAFEEQALVFDEFSRQFSDIYIEEGTGLDDLEITRFGPIHEKLEWTTEAPPPEDRAYGWIDPREFREWLHAFRRR